MHDSQPSVLHERAQAKPRPAKEWSAKEWREWNERLDACREKAFTSAKASSFKILTALIRHAKVPDGYCWPAVETLCASTGLSRGTIISGLAELASLRIVFRARLIEQSYGRTLPNLYRIGTPVEEIPVRMALHAVLAPEKPDLKPRARGEVQNLHLGGSKFCTSEGPNFGHRSKKRREGVPSQRFSQDAVSQSVSQSQKKEKKKANGAPAPQDLTDRLTDDPTYGETP